MTRTIKRKLIKARIKLNQTLTQILEINRIRKHLFHLDLGKAKAKEEALGEELKVLNKIVAQQAKLIQHYQTSLSAEPVRNDNILPKGRKGPRAA